MFKTLIFVLLIVLIICACSKSKSTGTVPGNTSVCFYTPLIQNSNQYVLYVDNVLYDTIRYVDYAGDANIINKDFKEVPPSRGRCELGRYSMWLSSGKHYLEFKSLTGKPLIKDSINIDFSFCSGFPVLNKK